MARQKKVGAPVPDENLTLVPYADPTCTLCHLPFEHLKFVHNLRFIDKMGYKALREYCRDNYGSGFGNDNTYYMAHFKEHCGTDKMQLVASTSKKLPIVDIALATEAMRMRTGKTDETVERAYDKLVKQTAQFTEKVEVCFKALNISFGNEEQVLTELVKLKPVALLKTLAELNNLAFDQVKDITALRAPKALVMQFLEDTLDKAVMEVNDVVSNVFILTQERINKLFVERNLGEAITENVFREIYMEIATKYKDRMVALRREQMTKAAAVLSDMEKII